MPCNITCDSETGFHHCIIDHEPSSVSNMEQTHINITFVNNNNYYHANNGGLCNCYPDSFAPNNCSILRPTQTTLFSNTKVLATTILFSTITTTTTTVTNTTNSINASALAPAVTVTMLLCVTVAAGSALLCALCMKKRKQDLATLHSDPKDQQRYSAYNIHIHAYTYMHIHVHFNV